MLPLGTVKRWSRYCVAFFCLGSPGLRSYARFAKLAPVCECRNSGPWLRQSRERAVRGGLLFLEPFRGSEAVRTTAPPLLTVTGLCRD